MCCRVRAVQGKWGAGKGRVVGWCAVGCREGKGRVGKGREGKARACRFVDL